MEIQKTSAPLVTSYDPNSPSSLLSQLKAGYSLDVVVTAKLAENRFVLKLSGGQLLHAQTPNVLELGQILKLEVVKAGAIPELKVIMPQAEQPKQAVVLQALRQFLPKQQSLTDFAVSLRQIAMLTAGKTDAVSVAIHETLGAVLPKDELISTEGLKRGISNSGFFLEAKLANPPLTLQGDLKGCLLRLADVLQNAQSKLSRLSSAGTIPLATGQAVDPAPSKTLPDLLAQAIDKDNALFIKTEGAIARIVLDQLASLPQGDGKQNVWQIEVPFTDGQHTDSAKLKIIRESKTNQASGQANWSVVLELNPPGLGTLYSKISLVDDRIDTKFWSDQQTLTALVREKLEFLSARYTQAGLAVGQLDALDGTAVNATSSGPSSLANLLDEHI
jgi:Flagellar hook-length control protein FliK